MHNLLSCALLVAMLFATGSCKKKNLSSVDDCFPDTSTVRTVLNAEATIQLLNGEYFIIEKNTIDTRLYPCNLAQEFRIDKLPVIVTGEVKNTIRSGVGPCCTDHFVILKISK